MGTPPDFVTFLETRTDSLLVTAFLLTRDRHRAEDLVQDTLVALYPKWHRVARADSATAYVRRCMVNRFLNQRRRHAPRLAGGEVAEPAVPGDFDDRVADRDRLRRALDRLPGRQRAALVLRYFHDLDDAAAARTLGCRTGTVRSLVSRALATLRADVALRAGDPGRAPIAGDIPRRIR